MKDKKVYVIDTVDHRVLVIPAPFDSFWEASRESLDVPKHERMEVLFDYAQYGKTKEYLMGSIINILCDVHTKPTEGDFYFIFGQARNFFVEIQIDDIVDKVGFFKALENPTLN